MIKGISKFAAGILPQSFFYYLTSIKLNIKAGAPIVKL
jgi:hypothetical protein